MNSGVGDWWRETEAAWKMGDLRWAARCLLEILRLDPDLDQVARSNLLHTDRVDLSGVPESALNQVRSIVSSMGPSAVRNDTKAAREERLRLVADMLGYLKPAA